MTTEELIALIIPAISDYHRGETTTKFLTRGVAINCGGDYTIELSAEGNRLRVEYSSPGASKKYLSGNWNQRAERCFTEAFSKATRQLFNVHEHVVR